MNGEALLQVKHLSKTFGKNVVLRDIDFNVYPGDVTCIIGASGSGKSTLLKIVRCLKPDERKRGVKGKSQCHSGTGCRL